MSYENNADQDQIVILLIILQNKHMIQIQTKLVGKKCLKFLAHFTFFFLFYSKTHTHKHTNSFPIYITKTYLYNPDPLKPHFYIVKLGFTGVYIIFLISVQKHRLWVLVRTASASWF